MVSEVARRKALASVLEKASVKDASGNVIDLESLFPREEDEVEEVVTASAPEGTTAPSTDPAAIQAFELGGFEPSEPAGGTGTSGRA
jgi:trigger factor